MKKRTTLTLKNLTELFAVTAPTIYAWQAKLFLPPLANATPAAIKRWATQTGTSMTCEPSTLLGKDILKPGPKPQPASETFARPGTTHRGKCGPVKMLTTHRPARAPATKAVAKHKVAR